MVIDSSAVIAWAQEEPEAAAIEEALVGAPVLVMSAFNVFETNTVFARRFPAIGLKQFKAFLENMGVRIIAFDADQAAIAFESYQRFGRGSGHPRSSTLGTAQRMHSRAH